MWIICASSGNLYSVFVFCWYPKNCTRPA